MTAPGPPPLSPFGLVLHHDGRWLHEDQPILNRKLREHFDRSVEYVPDEKKFIVRLKHFRAEIVVEEAAFFVRDIDAATGDVLLSDGSRSALDIATLSASPIDGAWLGRSKTELEPDGLLVRFSHAAQAELLDAVTFDEDDQPALEWGGQLTQLPEI